MGGREGEKERRPFDFFLGNASYSWKERGISDSVRIL